MMARNEDTALSSHTAIMQLSNAIIELRAKTERRAKHFDALVKALEDCHSGAEEIIGLLDPEGERDVWNCAEVIEQRSGEALDAAKED